MKRLDQIMGNNAWRAIILNMDKGVSIGEIKGLNKVRETLGKLPSLGATSVIMPKGLVGICYAGAGRGLGLIVNLSASPISSGKDQTIFVEGVEEASRMGADAIAVSMSFSEKGEPTNVRDIAHVAERCDSWGIPLLVMIEPIDGAFEIDTLVDLVRLSTEQGASIVSTPFKGSEGDFKEVVRACAKPVLVSGGLESGSIEQLKETTDNAMKSGALGVVVGKKMLLGKDVGEVIKSLSEVIFGEGTA